MHREYIYKSSILECPHCHEILNIKRESELDEKDVVEQLYIGFNTKHFCLKYTAPKVMTVNMCKKSVISAKYGTNISKYSIVKLMI